MISLITVSLHFHISMLFIFLFSNNIQSRDLDMKPFLDTLLKAGTP